jgi:hypothetical protein
MVEASRLSFDSPESLVALNDLVHDGWFRLSAIEYDDERHVLSIPVERESAEESRVQRVAPLVDEIVTPIREAELSIGEVKGFEFEDQADIDRYDINEVAYFSDAKEVLITSSFPVTVRIKVERLRLEIKSGDVVRYQIARRPGWPFARYAR